ncbi:probable RNA-binding protein EIF1AD [Culicoides brevitarsis]|uniref:probable RNA-binding protein EIF1AD n=1 Tax=Culicoides brevitarsis TaxID=469753 RepID=UPI00307B483C
MSRVNRQKHVLRELDADDFSVPKENQEIVRIVASKGNNLHEVESSNDEKSNFLVSMPTKFRRNVWIKRGDFVLVEPIEEGDKVKAEIVRILTPEHIKVFNEEQVWPKKFTKKREHEEEEDEDGLIPNRNRPTYESSDTEESEEEQEEEEEEEN